MDHDRSGITVRTIGFDTSDAVRLTGDISVPERVRGAAVVCHPHPQYGGNRHDPVVQTLFDLMPTLGVAVVRFDFRAEFGGGRLEILDVEAAINTLLDDVGGVPAFATGYSFGAMMALGVDHPRLVGRALIAPPLGALEVSVGRALPCLVLTPAHDQFCPPDGAQPTVAEWPDAEFVVVPSADHFLAGATRFVGDQVSAWIGARLPD